MAETMALGALSVQDQAIRMATQVTLICAQCGRRLTCSLRVAEESVRQTDAQDGAPVVPQGMTACQSQADHVVVQSHGPKGVQETRREVSAAGAWSVHPADVVREHLVPTGRNDHGCCGSDGMDGPNR